MQAEKLIKKRQRKIYIFTEVYLKIKDIVENQAYNLTINQAQNLVAERNTNGLSNCGKLIGRRFFIEQSKFEEWLNNYNINTREQEEHAGY